MDLCAMEGLINFVSFNDSAQQKMLCGIIYVQCFTYLFLQALYIVFCLLYRVLFWELILTDSVSNF